MTPTIQKNKHALMILKKSFFNGFLFLFKSKYQETTEGRHVEQPYFMRRKIKQFIK